MKNDGTRKLVELLVELEHAPDLSLAKQLMEVGVVKLNGHIVRDANYRVGIGWQYELSIGVSTKKYRF